MPRKNTNKAYGVTSVSRRALWWRLTLFWRHTAKKVSLRFLHRSTREKWVFRPANNVLHRKWRVLCIYAAGTRLILANTSTASRLGKSHLSFLDFQQEFQTGMGQRNILLWASEIGSLTVNDTFLTFMVLTTPNISHFCLLPCLLFQQANQKRPSLPDTIKMPVRFSLMQTAEK